MTESSSNDDFEAYLTRRRPIQTGPSPTDGLEPPAELDRIVIGKARQAIQPPPTLRMFRGPGWALPVGLVATLSLVVVVGLHFGARMPSVAARVKEAATPAAQSVAGAQAGDRAAKSPAFAGKAAEVQLDREAHPDPAVWLAAIQKLRATGQTDAAERELSRFRDAYPDYRVPAPPPSADGRVQ